MLEVYAVISSILSDTQRKLNTETHLAHKLDLYIFFCFRFSLPNL